jgi:hypothetical protein
LFEAKTINEKNRPRQVRSAVSQLFEYRFFFGEPTDSLYIVTNAPLPEATVRFLDSMRIAACRLDGECFYANSPLARPLLGAVLAE